jgi:glycerol-3-phosphate acyltransferase PlsX
MITIAVDAMGGDYAPGPEIEGSLRAARELGVSVLLVGQPQVLRNELAKHGAASLPVRIMAASEAISMRDSPALAFRRKKDSSIHVAARLVRAGKADGMVSAGNTGAVMAVARSLLGTLPSVDRVALAAPFPNAKGGVSVLLDVGANVDSKPEHLEQFAVMGEAYYRVIFGCGDGVAAGCRPRVGLLSIGEEEAKGNEVTREAHNLLKRSTLNFLGNVEGRDLFSGHVDVIVCDGFVGNIALKICEGLALHLFGLMKKALESTLASQLGALFTRGAFKGLRKHIDYSEYGGAPLLGVHGICVIGHGRSNANAIKNAIRIAAALARARMNDRIEEELASMAALA